MDNPVNENSISEVDYQLIDFGAGRKLEALGYYWIDRPSPAADGVKKRSSTLWKQADAVHDRDTTEGDGWLFHVGWPAGVAVRCGRFRMQVSPTPFGHLGLFPEQRRNWEWIDDYVRSRRDCEVLNLFAYTGASTLAAAAAGASVTHVDAAKPNVEMARTNARISGLADAPIRYLIEDAVKYVGREARRGRRYDLIILDPPAYGHGTSGRAWRLERDLWSLLNQCLGLTKDAGGAILFSGHTSSVGTAEVAQWIGSATPCRPAIIEQSGRMGLSDQHGRWLDAGFFVRITVPPSLP